MAILHHFILTLILTLKFAYDVALACLYINFVFKIFGIAIYFTNLFVKLHAINFVSLPSNSKQDHYSFIIFVS